MMLKGKSLHEHVMEQGGTLVALPYRRAGRRPGTRISTVHALRRGLQRTRYPSFFTNQRGSPQCKDAIF
jgi:hypothetical protein